METERTMSSPKQNKDALGKGIRSLLQSIDSDLKTGTGGLKTSVVETATGVSRIAVRIIKPIRNHQNLELRIVDE